MVKKFAVHVILAACMHMDSPTDDASAAYDAWVKGHPGGTLWQSLEYKEYLEARGKGVWICVGRKGNAITSSAIIVEDMTAFGITTWDISRGPIGEGREDLLTGIVREAGKRGVMSVTWSPSTEVTLPGARASGRHVQPEATRIIDLTQDEEAILTQMKPKGRYNIKVAEKHGVVVTASTDIDAYYALVEKTTARDKFRGHGAGHYRTFLEKLPGAFLMLAYAKGSRVMSSELRDPPTTHNPQPTNIPIAGLLGVTWNNQGIYYYGASDHDARELMAPYLLQWEAMRHCKALGCVSYDLLGVAPPDAPKTHPWAGITAFKEKFGGKPVRYPPEQEIVLRPLAKRAIGWKRKILG